ncbi:MAG: hypothetical protein OQJ97_16245 [Rhodospirillales bacterium]|nr:hypothetical protein [Rhodospirillales bacterium]
MVGGKEKIAQLPKIGDQHEDESLVTEKPRKAPLNRKVESLIERHPDRAVKVVRDWLDEGRGKD